MKILYHFRTRGTGAEAVHIAGVARAFERLGHAVTFSSPTGVDPRRSAGADPFAQGGGSLPGLVFEVLEIAYNAVAFLKNARLLLRERPGMIYERHAFFLFSTALLARLFGVPLVVEVNELVGDARIRKPPALALLARLADKITFRLARAVVVVSPHLKRKIAGLGISGRKILVLPNGVDEEDFRVLPDPGPVRNRLGLQDALMIGFAGWFVEWHRLEMMLEVFAGLAGGNPRLRLLMAGSGPLEQDLRAQAARLGVADRVVWAGVVEHAEMPAIMAAMDICLVPHSNAYRSPIKLFEYMAMARPVVAPATEPIQSVVENGVTGLLFEPGDAPGLLGALERLVSDEALRSQVGNAARMAVLARHTWRHNAAEVLKAAGYL